MQPNPIKPPPQATPPSPPSFSTTLSKSSATSISQPPDANTPPPTTPPPTNKPKNTIALVLSLLLVVAFGIAGYFGYMYYQSNQQPTVDEQPTIEATPTPTLDPTANWETYKNEEFGFSVKFPPDKYTKCDNDSGDDGLRLWKANFNCPTAHDILYVIGMLGYKPGEYTQSKSPSLTSPIQVDGFDGLKHTYIYEPNDGPLYGIGRSTQVVLETTDETIVIQLLGNNAEEVDIFNQILSTFEFIEKAKTSCITAGCGGELCVDESQYEEAPFVTTCEYKESYECYSQYSSCQRQDDGDCGWTETESLTLCLINADQ